MWGVGSGVVSLKKRKGFDPGVRREARFKEQLGVTKEREGFE